jgi:hypothetical protein
VQQRLGRNATDVQTHPAQRLPAVDEDHLLAQVGGAERGGVAAGPTSQHEHFGMHVALGGNRRPRAGPGRRRKRNRLPGRRGGADAQEQNGIAFGHPVASRDPHLRHAASSRSRHLHAGLVGLQRNERIVRFDLGAGRDVDLDDLDLLEVANIRDLDLHEVVHAAGRAVVRRPRVRRRASRRALLHPLLGRNAGRRLWLEQRDDVPFRHPVARLDPELSNRPRLWAGHLHAGFVRLEGDQRIFRFDFGAGRHLDLDNRHVLEVADVRDADLDSSHACFSGQSTRRRTSSSTRHR